MCLIQSIGFESSFGDLRTLSQIQAKSELPSEDSVINLFFFFFFVNIMFNVYMQPFGYARLNSLFLSPCSLDQTCNIVPLCLPYAFLVF